MAGIGVANNLNNDVNQLKKIVQALKISSLKSLSIMRFLLEDISVEKKEDKKILSEIKNFTKTIDSFFSNVINLKEKIDEIKNSHFIDKKEYNKNVKSLFNSIDYFKSEIVKDIKNFDDLFETYTKEKFEENKLDEGLKNVLNYSTGIFQQYINEADNNILERLNHDLKLTGKESNEIYVPKQKLFDKMNSLFASSNKFIKTANDLKLIVESTNEIWEHCSKHFNEKIKPSFNDILTLCEKLKDLDPDDLSFQSYFSTLSSHFENDIKNSFKMNFDEFRKYMNNLYKSAKNIISKIKELNKLEKKELDYFNSLEATFESLRKIA